MDPRSDAAIIDAVIDGDVHAFGVLVARYRDNYTRFAVRMLGNRDDADDALQMAFIRAFRALPRCRDRKRFAPWLYRIVVNECRTLGARRGKRERRFVHDEEELGRAMSAAPADSAFATSEIQNALDQLDPLYREAFLLKHIEELSYEEMVEITGAGQSALKMRVKRACERLRELLEGVYS
jgi:RNA polymerase sigma-70 factor, ECF subfamily